jgi:hypothetical protein
MPTTKRKKSKQKKKSENKDTPTTKRKRSKSKKKSGTIKKSNKAALIAGLTGGSAGILGIVYLLVERERERKKNIINSINFIQNLNEIKKIQKGDYLNFDATKAHDQEKTEIYWNHENILDFIVQWVIQYKKLPNNDITKLYIPITNDDIYKSVIKLPTKDEIIHKLKKIS